MLEQSGTRTTPRLDLGRAVPEFILRPQDLIALRALPLFRAQLKAGVFNAITRECLTRLLETQRAGGGKYNRINSETEEKSFSCVENGLEGALGDDERALYANDFDAELATVEQIYGLILLKQEYRAASALFNTTTFTGSSLYTDVSGTNPWATAASDIVATVRAAKEKIRQNTGLIANTVIMNETNFNYCKTNTAIKAMLQYTQVPTDDIIAKFLAAILGVQQVLVGKAVYNSANKGKTFSSSEVWSASYVMVAVCAQADSLNLAAPSVGRTFLWAADSAENPVVEEYRDDTVRGDVFRVRHSTHENVIDAYFAHLLKVA